MASARSASPAARLEGGSNVHRHQETVFQAPFLRKSLGGGHCPNEGRLKGRHGVGPPGGHCRVWAGGDGRQQGSCSDTEAASPAGTPQEGVLGKDALASQVGRRVTAAMGARVLVGNLAVREEWHIS